MRLVGWAAIPMWLVSLADTWTQTQTERRPDEDTWGPWPSANWGEEPQKKSTLPTLWSWTSSLQNCEKVHSHKPPNLWYFVMAVVVNEYKTKYNLPITIFSGSKENQNISSMEVDYSECRHSPSRDQQLMWGPIRSQRSSFQFVWILESPGE